MSIKDKLIMYVYRKMNEIEREKEQLRYCMRYQPMDSLDIYEALRTDIKLQCFNEIMQDLFKIVLNCK